MPHTKTYYIALYMPQKDQQILKTPHIYLQLHYAVCKQNVFALTWIEIVHNLQGGYDTFWNKFFISSLSAVIKQQCICVARLVWSHM